MKSFLLLLLLLLSSTALATKSFGAEKFHTILRCWNRAGDDNMHVAIIGKAKTYCIEKGSKSPYATYSLDLLGLGFGISATAGHFSVDIYSILPFGDLEGHYLGVDAGLGINSGAKAGVFVGEFGGKYLVISDLAIFESNDPDRDDLSEHSIVQGFHARISGISLEHYTNEDTTNN